MLLKLGSIIFALKKEALLKLALVKLTWFKLDWLKLDWLSSDWLKSVALCTDKAKFAFFKSKWAKVEPINWTFSELLWMLLRPFTLSNKQWLK